MVGSEWMWIYGSLWHLHLTHFCKPKATFCRWLHAHSGLWRSEWRQKSCSLCLVLSMSSKCSVCAEYVPDVANVSVKSWDHFYAHQVCIYIHVYTIYIIIHLYTLCKFIYNPWRTSMNLPKMVSSCHQQFKIAQPCSLACLFEVLRTVPRSSFAGARGREFCFARASNLGSLKVILRILVHNKDTKGSKMDKHGHLMIWFEYVWIHFPSDRSMYVSTCQ